MTDPMQIVETVAEDGLAAALPGVGVPLKAWEWVKGHTALIGAGVVIAALLAVAALFWAQGRTHAAAQKAQATLDSNVAGATRASGADAVNTVEHDITNEHNITNEVNDAQAAVSAAPDMAGADAAGHDGLCRISADLCAASGMQQPDPR